MHSKFIGVNMPAYLMVYIACRAMHVFPPLALVCLYTLVARIRRKVRGVYITRSNTGVVTLAGVPCLSRHQIHDRILAPPPPNVIISGGHHGLLDYRNKQNSDNVNLFFLPLLVAYLNFELTTGSKNASAPAPQDTC